MTQLALFAAAPDPRPWSRYFVRVDSRNARGGFAAVEGRLRKAQARRRLPEPRVSMRERWLAWSRAARSWPAGSPQRKDFAERARSCFALGGGA